MHMQLLHVCLFFLCIQAAIAIDLKKCPILNTPKNGYVICDHLLGAFCAPVCNSGYNFETTPATAYVCNPVTKSWATYPAGYPLPWPGCTIVDQASSASSLSPMKKSRVYTNRVQGDNRLKNDSLWQRMLQLTSELSQKKAANVNKGATRSELNLYSNNKQIVYPTVSSSTYSATNAYTKQGIYNQQTEFERLQEYWNEYYKNYYQSVNVKNKQNGNVVADWSMGSPWSTDPEQVQGALDKDTIGKADQPNSTTFYQNWNSYLQSFYKYPTKSAYSNMNTTVGYSATVPNSSSDHFIDNVISNDLQAKRVSDASVDRDLYYEDQLIHFEEQTRPYLNGSNVDPTMTVYPQTTAQNNWQQMNATNSTVSSALNDSTETSPYNNSYRSDGISPYNNSTTVSSFINTRTTDKSTALANTQNGKNNPLKFNTSKQETLSAVSNQVPVTSEKSHQNTFGYGGYMSSAEASYIMKNDSQDTAMQLSSSQGKSYSSNLTNVTTTPTLKYAINNYTARNSNMVQEPLMMQSYTPNTADQDDDNDYLDDLDITALVRELIKLETIRNQRQIRKKKKVAKENAKIVGNMTFGDVFKSYFKNKQVAHQKALKKHLLNKARILIRSKGKLSPLPKFS